MPKYRVIGTCRESVEAIIDANDEADAVQRAQEGRCTWESLGTFDYQIDDAEPWPDQY